MNFPAAKPLEPVLAQGASEQRLEDIVSKLLTAPAVSPHEGTLFPNASSLARIVELAADARRPLIVVGPRAPHDTTAPKGIAELADSCGWPVYAEPASQLRTQDLAMTSCEAFDALCRTPRAGDYRPDFVLHFGQPATSGAWANLFTHGQQPQCVVVSDHTWADPHNAATLMLRASQHETAASLLGRLPPADVNWRAQLAQANQAALDCTQRWLQARDAAEPAPEGCHVRKVLDELQPGDLLIVGNSLPIRLLDTVCTRLPAGVRVLSQRGANGIDGLISLAVGAANARSSGRAVLLLGDVSALHDVGGLYALSTQRPELSCVILNNGGGRIFEQLPVAGHARMEAWTTPHDVALHQLANAFHVPGVRVDSAHDLRAALALGRRDGGPIWIEARCQPHGAHQMYTELTQEITNALPPSS